jgi:hypothetical protein
MQDIYEPVMQRIIPYMFCIGLIGIFMLVVMRKRFIIDYRLHFPSGTATGILIAGFHTPKGEAQAREQVGSHAAAIQFCILKAMRDKCWTSSCTFPPAPPPASSLHVSTPPRARRRLANRCCHLLVALQQQLSVSCGCLWGPGKMHLAHSNSEAQAGEQVLSCNCCFRGTSQVLRERHVEHVSGSYL